MNIGIAYALPKRQAWLNVQVPDEATVQDAIERSGILKQFPEIDLAQQKVGIFGKVVTLETKLADGDRIEIYRPLLADPQEIRARIKKEEDSSAS